MIPPFEKGGLGGIYQHNYLPLLVFFLNLMAVTQGV
jgi:hypothetical protein